MNVGVKLRSGWSWFLRFSYPVVVIDITVFQIAGVRSAISLVLLVVKHRRASLTPCRVSIKVTVGKKEN